jgi:hypothetical protein
MVGCDPWRLVALGRMQKVGYTHQISMLTNIFKKYSIRLGMCDQYQSSVRESLCNAGLRIVGVPVTPQSRPELLWDLCSALEKFGIRIPSIENTANADLKQELAVLKGQIENFTPMVSKTGTVKYQAARGFHDDYVFALAMAVKAGTDVVLMGDRGGFVASSRAGVLR